MQPQRLAETPKLVSLKDIKTHHKVKHLINGANEVMKAMGYTEHGQRESLMAYLSQSCPTSMD